MNPNDRDRIDRLIAAGWRGAGEISPGEDWKVGVMATIRNQKARRVLVRDSQYVYAGTTSIAKIIDQ